MAARFLACAEDFQCLLFLNPKEDETTALGTSFHSFLGTVKLELPGRSIVSLSLAMRLGPGGRG